MTFLFLYCISLIRVCHYRLFIKPETQERERNVENARNLGNVHYDIVENDFLGDSAST